jgi:hypothetical protein
MAGAGIIASAIGILLLVLVSYVIVGNNLTSADIIASAQKDMVMKAEEQMNTATQISAVSFYGSWPNYYLHFHLTNTGNEIISNFNSTDVFVNISPNAPVYYRFDATSFACGDGSGCGDADLGTWNYAEFDVSGPDIIHPTMLDPGETLSIRIGNFHSNPAKYMVQATTPNGVSATYNV